MNGEHRYRQATTKARILSNRNLRKFLADELPWLPESKDREFIISEFNRLHEEIERLRAALKICSEDCYLDEFQLEYRPTSAALTARAALEEREVLAKPPAGETQCPVAHVAADNISELTPNATTTAGEIKIKEAALTIALPPSHGANNSEQERQ